MTSGAMVDRLRDVARRLVRPSGSPPRPSWRGQVFDASVALGLSLTAILAGGGDEVHRSRAVVDGQGQPLSEYAVRAEPFLPIEREQDGWSVVLLLVVLPLVLRRRYPLAMLWVVLATAPWLSDYNAALRVSFYACVIAAYTAAVYSPYRLPALASLPVAALLYTRIQEPAVPTVPDNAVPFLIFIPIVVAADGLRRWKRRADEHRTRLSIVEREQAAALLRAAAYERARIARELHDVVTHNVSVMVIQAGAARTVLEERPDQAREALLAVEAGGRAAMAELRHVMGLLTMDDDVDPSAAAGLTPQPSLDRLEALVWRVREAGTPVELTVTGEPRPLPPGVELAAYRVVQEALTNTVKHAAGASATALIEYGADRLRVEVTDTGGGSGASGGSGNGRGLIGLRERLAVYGGTLHAGRRVTGGYRVTAQIPVEVS